jgi:hypothetical protein
VAFFSLRNSFLLYLATSSSQVELLSVP